MRLNDFMKSLAIIFRDRLDFRAEGLAIPGGYDAHGLTHSTFVPRTIMFALRNLSWEIVTSGCQRKPAMLNAPGSNEILGNILNDRKLAAKHQDFKAVLVIEMYVQA